MNQTNFEQLYREQWQEFSHLLDLLETDQGKGVGSSLEPSLFPAQYRRLCNQYGIARSRHYSPALVDRLHVLVLRGHRQLYRKKSSLFWQGLRFVSSDFPRAVRGASRTFWLALLLFFGPALLVGYFTYHDPVFIYTVMGEQQVSQMESMYDPANGKIGRTAERDAETDFAMFGYYIMNNISIGFKTFASGILFGLGSVFFLLYNGTIIGGISGHLSHPPFTTTFWQFVSGHGAFELIAIVISGSAGLQLGQSLVFPGELRRIDALRSRAPEALKLVVGAALMLICAAFIEAFWSSNTLAPIIKFQVAGAFWLLVIAYLLFAGRRS
jgi:uncharacterized membrane protein SpoIIM required for sporulation